MRRDRGSGRTERDEQFRAFVVERRPRLVHTATLLTAGDGHLAEDLVQATLTKLYVAWPAHQRAANPDAYVRRVLVNALIDERRRIWRHREQPMAELPDVPAGTAAGTGPVADGLKQALRELPPRMRAAVVFRYFYDLGVAETADALDCTEGHRQEPDRPRARPPAHRPRFVRRFSRSNPVMDLHEHLDQIAGPVTAPTAAQADADVARGRRALLRRRASRTVAGSAFGVAALVAAFTVATDGTHSNPPAAVASAQLVAYQGAQPKGFTVDKVPAGFFIQSDDDYTLLLAPKSAVPAVPSTDPDGTSFVGKITIMLESKDQHGPSRAGDAVTVGDQRGSLLQSLDSTDSADPGWELWVKQPSGVYLIIQFWEGLGLSKNQMVELGAGVHVHADAQQGVG